MSFFTSIHDHLSLLRKARKKMRLLYQSNSYLVQTGFVRSIDTGESCAADGTPLPWMNYAVIDFLRERLNNTMTLFEYGCGSSTSFYAQRVKHVYAVEHASAWYEKVTACQMANVTLMLRSLEEGSYQGSIAAIGTLFDVVVVDGMERPACLEYACEFLNEKGVLIYDDTHIKKNKDAVLRLTSRGFNMLHFTGLKPI